MERQSPRREEEMMVHRGDLRNQWQPAATQSRREKERNGVGANSHGELEEWAGWCYHHSLPRRRRLQGEMWSEIQKTLKTERILGSVSRSVGAEPCQRAGVNISENIFNCVSSHQPHPYTSVKYDTSRRMFDEQDERKVLSSFWSQPPDYAPPPLYSSRPDLDKLTGALEPLRFFPNLSMEDKFGNNRIRTGRQKEHRSISFSDRRRHSTTFLQCSSGDRTPGTVNFLDPDRTHHQQELWPSIQQQVKNQEQVFTPQSSGHQEKHQTLNSDITLTKPKRRRNGGTIFCLVSQMGELTGLSRVSNDEPLKCQAFPLLKSSVFTETPQPVQLADEADSLRSLTSFTREPTPEEPREEHQNQSDQNVRLSKHRGEVSKDREEVRKQSMEKRCFIEQSKKKCEDSDSHTDKDNITPAVSSKSTTLVIPHHQTTLKFPLWKEPKSHHNSHGVLEKNNQPNRNVSNEGQYEQSEPRNNMMTNENMGLMVIDATCEVIRVEMIVSPEKEHVQDLSSHAIDSSKQSCDSKHDHKTTEQTTERHPGHKIMNQSGHTFNQVQSKHQTLKERAERILGITLQDSFNEAHTLEETTEMENSRIQQIYSKGSAEAESESWLKAECENVQIPETSTTNEEETPSSMSEAEAMLEIFEVTHGDAANNHTEHQTVVMTSSEQEKELKSVDRKFMLGEKIPPTVIDMKEKQVKDSADDRPSGEKDDFQNLNQTILRNTSDMFSQKRERREDNLLPETDERRNLKGTLLGRSVENAIEPFSPEDTHTEGNSSNIRDHVEHTSDLPEIYERGGNKVCDQETNPTEVTPSERFSLEGDHYQENLCPNLWRTSQTLHQESGTSQNLSYSGDPQVCPPFHGHHVENINESFAHEGIPRGDHLSDVGPNLLNSSVLIITDTLRQDRPSHAKHDANHLYQTLPAHDMENTTESHDQEDPVGEETLSSDVNNLHPSFSVKDIRESFEEQSPLHEEAVEILSSELLGEHGDLNEGKLPETTDMKKFSPNLFRITEENPESSEQQVSSKKDLLVDDLQNLCPLLFGGSVAISVEDNEGRTSPSPDLHTLSKEELASSFLSTSHSEISPHPPDHVSSTCPSPPLPAACSSHSRPSEITSVYAQVCSSASSAACKYIGVIQCPQSLWDAVSRIRKHTAPDSEREDEDSELMESVEHTEDDLFTVNENTGIKEEECVLEETSGHTGNSIKDGMKAPSEEERRLGERDDGDGDDSLSSSSVDSQDTVIEGEGKLNVLETDEEEKNNQEPDLFISTGCLMEEKLHYALEDNPLN